MLRPEDARTAVREGREANLILFCVDASGSMAARKRMGQVKTAILSLLLDAYRRRDKVGLISFRGRRADLVRPPTHSVDVAAARLDDLSAGGRTPLAEGLLEAAAVLTRERRRDPRLRPLLIVVTDGRATGGADALARSELAAAHLAGLGVMSVVIDGESMSLAGQANIPPITRDYPEFGRYLPWGPFYGVFVRRDTPADVTATLVKAFKTAGDNPQFVQLMKDRGNVMMNVSGAEADAFLKKWQSVTSWVLQDVGAAKVSPEKFGIPRP